MVDFRNKKRVCPYCNKEFYPQKNNQKFCSSRCRTTYHNNINNEIRRARSFVDKKLHKNYSVLTELMMGNNFRSLKKEFLKGSGYSFKVLTHFQQYDGEKRHAIYDFLIIEDGLNINVIRY